MKLIALLIMIQLLSSCSGPQSEFAKIPNPAFIEFGEGGGSDSSFSLMSDWKSIEKFEVGRRPVDSLSKFQVSVKNSGDLPAKIKNIQIETEQADSFSFESQCGSVINTGSTCLITIIYEPQVIGSTPGSLKVIYDVGNGGTAESILPISALANNLACLKFEVDRMDLKTSTIGYSVSAFIKVLYNGSAMAARGISVLPAKGVIISDPSDDAFKIDRSSETTCGDIIQADCVIKVVFSPLSGTGAKSASFSLNYFNGAEVLQIESGLDGTALAATRLAELKASSLGFGNVVANPVAPSVLQLPIVFDGSVPADNVVITGPKNSIFQINYAQSTCKAGTINGNCSLSISYSPVDYIASTDSISIDYSSNGQARPQLKATISGNGVRPALIKSSAPSLAFGSIPAYKASTLSFTLTNSGDVAISALSAITNSDVVNFSASFESGCTNLAATKTCKLNVTFKTKLSTILNASFGFSYFDGREVKQVSLSASATGTSPLVMEGSRTIDFGNVVIGNPKLPAAASVGLSIYGTTALSTAAQLVIKPTQLSAPFAFPAAGIPGSTASCKAILDPKKSNSCSFSVALIANTGFVQDVAKNEAFTIDYLGDGDQGKGTLSFIAKMTPRVAPSLAFSVQPTFNSVSVNNSQSVQFVIKNNSPYFATAYRSLALEGDSVFTISSNTCSGGVVAGGTCAINVVFKPNDEGTFKGKLKYAYNDLIVDQSISADFSAQGSSDVTLAAVEATTVDFGEYFVGDVIPAKVINLKYYGKKDWTYTAAVPSPFKIDGSACGSPSDCKLSIGYNPIAAGSFNSSVDFIYSPGLSKPAKITFILKGSAKLRAPTLSITPVSFPKTLIGQESIQAITIKNTGNTVASGLKVADFGIGGVFSFPEDGLQGSSGNCASNATLNPNESCTVKVKFSPKLVVKSTSNLSVSLSNAAATSVTLSGQGTQMLQVFAGAFQTCMINELNQTFCFGRNSSGQLGVGNNSASVIKPQNSAPINFGANVKVKKLAVGDAHTCALVDEAGALGEVICWGNNESGRLGLGISDAIVSAPLKNNKLNVVKLGHDSNAERLPAIDIVAGFEHTCALLKSGDVKCWGGNTSGQLGIDSTQKIGSLPAQMDDALKAVNLGGRQAISISAGAGHTCAVLQNDTVKCWGDNFYGQLGQGTDTEKVGVQASDMAGLEAILLGSGFQPQGVFASSGAFTCALSVSGDVKCFGKTVANESSTKPFYGVLGQCWSRSAYNSSAVPCPTDGRTPASTSFGYFSSDMGDHLSKVNLGSVSASQLAVGSSFSCFLGSDKSVRCWGLNQSGQLGIGTKDNIGSLVSDMGDALKPAISDAVQVVAGYEHVCAVLNNNTLKCWGSGVNNATGLLSLGVSGSTGTTAATVPSKLAVVYDGR